MNKCTSEIAIANELVPRGTEIDSQQQYLRTATINEMCPRGQYSTVNRVLGGHSSPVLCKYVAVQSGSQVCPQGAHVTSCIPLSSYTYWEGSDW